MTASATAPAGSAPSPLDDQVQIVRDLLCNPLSVVRGSAQTLLARELEETVRIQLLEAIVSASTELERVAFALLGVSQPGPVQSA